MCTYSMIADHYGQKWGQYLQFTPPQIPNQAELDEFRQLLERAREYDRRNHEPGCELDEKKDRIRQLAKELGVEVAFL